MIMVMMKMMMMAMTMVVMIIVFTTPIYHVPLVKMLRRGSMDDALVSG